MFVRPASGGYTIYGVKDPRTKYFVYVGQTSDLEERKRSYLSRAEGAEKPEQISRKNIRTWLDEAVSAGIIPLFVVLATADTWKKSVQVEADWIRRLTEEKHPLLNKWHQLNETNSSQEKPAMKLPATVLPANLLDANHNLPVFRMNASRPELQLRAPLGSAGRPWTKALDDELLALLKAGNGTPRIAAKMGRTPGAIRSRQKRLGLVVSMSGLYASVKPVDYTAGNPRHRRYMPPPGIRADYDAPWTTIMDHRLTVLYRVGRGATEIGRKMTKTEEAVRSRLVHLGLIAKPYNLKD